MTHNFQVRRKNKKMWRKWVCLQMLLPTMVLALSVPKAPLVGVILDMDGTLIQPCIDFVDLRKRIYEVASEDAGMLITSGDVVTMVNDFSPSNRQRAHEIFHDIEVKALRDMKAMPGMLDLCRYLDDHNIKRAILTRNVASSIQYLHQNLMVDEVPFYPQVARDSVDEHGNEIRMKPNSDGINYICRVWNCLPSQTIMIGDSDQDDVVAGNRAGCGATIHLVTGKDNDSGNVHESSLDDRKPTFRVDSLGKIIDLLDNYYITTKDTLETEFVNLI
jgi:phosphoglycolate phosphatase-like HAD superfamily hydrolase